MGTDIRERKETTNRNYEVFVRGAKLTTDQISLKLKSFVFWSLMVRNLLNEEKKNNFCYPYKLFVHR